MRLIMNLSWLSIAASFMLSPQFRNQHALRKTVIPSATQLEQLAKISKFAIDTVDIAQLYRSRLTDATINPILIRKAAQLPKYEPLVLAAIEYGVVQSGGDNSLELELITDYLNVLFGSEISRMVVGVISAEVDACLSFDSAAMVTRALRIVGMYS